jgi:hypothetical protein
MTYQIIYSSEATAAMSVSDLERILADARSGNAARGITGALLYVDGVFLQILEGNEDTVRELMRHIAADTRHGAVKVFHEAAVEEPMFGNWRMAFLSATPEQMAVWAGLEGAASLEAILEDIRRSPQRVSRVAANILKALAA